MSPESVSREMAELREIVQAQDARIRQLEEIVERLPDAISEAVGIGVGVSMHGARILDRRNR